MISRFFILSGRTITKILNNTDDSIAATDTEDDDINVEDDEEEAEAPTQVKKPPSIFSVSSLLSNTNSSKNKSETPTGSTPTKPPKPGIEKDEITPEVLASRPFFYPGLTLDILKNRQQQQQVPPNPTWPLGGLFPPVGGPFGAAAAMKALDANRNLLNSGSGFPFPLPGKDLQLKQCKQTDFVYFRSCRSIAGSRFAEVARAGRCVGGFGSQQFGRKFRPARSAQSAQSALGRRVQLHEVRENFQHSPRT